MRRVRVVISGDVHNVGFRSWAKGKAEHFGVKGWVRNNIDGTVEAVFEAEDYRIDDVLDACRRGPPGSYVEGVKTEDEQFRGEFRDFKIIS